MGPDGGDPGFGWIPPATWQRIPCAGFFAYPINFYKFKLEMLRVQEISKYHTTYRPTRLHRYQLLLKTMFFDRGKALGWKPEKP